MSKGCLEAFSDGVIAIIITITILLIDLPGGNEWQDLLSLTGNPFECGGKDEWNNGNGSLMRIMPACLYCYAKGMQEEDAVRAVRAAGSLTHGHLRANIACGLAALYYGYSAIPEAWLAEIKKREWIEELCRKADTACR